MTHRLIVDIETMLGENAEDALAPFVDELKEKKTRTVTRGKSLSDLADGADSKADVALQKGALSPVCGRIACIGVREVQEESYSVFPELTPAEITDHFIYNIDEKKMLEEFKKLIKPQTQLITFNGKNFDFPFLMFRAAIHKISLKLDIYPYNKDYGKENVHIDLFVHLNQISNLSMLGSDWGLKMVSLKKWMQYFGLGTKLSIADGDISIVECINSGNIEKLKEYCMNDVQKTYELFEFFKYNFQ